LSFIVSTGYCCNEIADQGIDSASGAGQALPYSIRVIQLVIIVVRDKKIKGVRLKAAPFL